MRLPLRAATAAAALAVAAALAPHVLGAPPSADRAAAVDAVFARWTHDTPGCAVGVAVDGKPVLAKGYGTADLEHDVSITTDTIFEAGSVSKQFTAAAVLLLAREGKLSLDDPVRTYIPELPDYPLLAATDSPVAAGTPAVSLTIRHMLTHTSGLRDWGNIEAIAGWPRTTRAYTHADVLDIVHRQRSLNFTPGTRWSYSNTNYNLAAIIVERVSGRSFQEFTRARLFKPLGMTHTSWRDDYTQIVKGRAVAYSNSNGTYYTDMPFENVYGNGGLLTTVGDLLKWNAHFDAPGANDPLSAREQQRPGAFTDGRTHGYALGLFIGAYKGVREVYHSGSTAGYNAFLTRFPDRHLSVAVLCNTTTAQAAQDAHRVADAYLSVPLALVDPAASYTMTAADRQHVAGLYRNDDTGAPLTIGGVGNVLEGDRAELVPQSAVRFVTASRQIWDVDAHGLRRTDEYGTIEHFSRATPSRPTAAELQQFVGVYVSDEAETELQAAVVNGRLVLERRPNAIIRLTPAYTDTFTAEGFGTVIFKRGSGAPGKIEAFSVVQDRVWNLRFRKQVR